MQRLRPWLRQWLGIEALDAANAEVWKEARLTRVLLQTYLSADRTPPTPETPKATATPSEPEFFDPVMGRL